MPIVSLSKAVFGGDYDEWVEVDVTQVPGSYDQVYAYYRPEKPEAGWTILLHRAGESSAQQIGTLSLDGMQAAS